MHTLLSSNTDKAQTKAAIKVTTGIKIDEILEPILSYLEFDTSLTQALKTFYRTRHQLRTPLLSQLQPITDINLSITETHKMTQPHESMTDQKKGAGDDKDDTRLNPQLRHFEEMYNVSITQIIKPTEVFARRGQDKTDPRRVLVLGRAGVGKTTMSQFVLDVFH